MANDIDPRLINEAVDFYQALIAGKTLRNPNNFPTDQNELILAIQRAAFRSGQQPMLERYSAKLRSITKKELPKQSIPNAAGETGPAADPEKVKQIREKMDLIDKQYEPIPEGASALESVHTYAKIIAEASALAGIMTKNPAWGYSMAIQSPEFKKFENDLLPNLQHDLSSLKNNPAAMRYLKDYPALADGIGLGFTGTLKAIQMPIREALVHTMILASDPEVRAAFSDFHSLTGDNHEAAWDNAWQKVDKSLTKAYYSRDVRDRRLPLDLFLDIAASPAVLERMGLPSFANQNLIWDAMKGTKTAALNLKDRMRGTYVENAVNFFRNKWDVQSEKFGEALYNQMKSMFGEEIANEIKGKIETNLASLYASTRERTATAERIYKGIHQGISDIRSTLTPDEQVAVVYMQQNANKEAPPAAQAVMNSPRVEAAYLKVHKMLEDIKSIDYTPNTRSGYWPAYEQNTSKGWTRIEEAQNRFWLKERATDIVHANPETVDHAWEMLVQRIAHPYINAMKVSAHNNANVVASVAFDTLDEYIKTPQRLSVIKDALQAAPIAKTGPINQALNEFMNTAMLKMRTGSWILRDSFNNVINQAVNVISRAKAGQPISFHGFFGDAPVPADITDNLISGQMAGRDARSMAMMSMLRKAWDLPYELNRGTQNLFNSAMYKFNYGSELKALSQEAGVPVEQLGEDAIKLAEQRAVDATKKFGNAYSFGSAFTQNFWSRIFSSPFLSFYLKSAAQTAQYLGEVPEVFKLGTYALHKLNLNNAEYGLDYKRNMAKVGNKEFNPLTALPIWPVIKMMRDSYYGNTPDMNDKLELKAKEVEQIPDVEARFRVIDADPALREHIINRPVKYMANFLEAVRESQAFPLGAATVAGLAKLGGLKEYTPHLIPGGRQISNLLRGIGLDNVDPEGAVIPRVKAYNQATFDADVANEVIRMQMNGSAKDLNGQDLFKLATTNVRHRMLSDFFYSSMLGVKSQDAPEIDKLWNVLQDVRERPDLAIPSIEESQRIKDATGIHNQYAVDMVWRSGFMNDPQQFLKMKETTKRDQLQIMRNFPESGDAAAYSFAANNAWKHSATSLNDSLTANKSIPYRNIADLMPTDRTLQALAYSLGSQEVVDENGNVVGMKIDFNADKPNELRDFIWDFLRKTPTDQLAQYRSNDPRNVLIKEFFPRRYQELRLMAPHVENPYFGTRLDNPQLRKDLHGIQLAPEPIEDIGKSDKFKELWSTLKELHPERPLDFPASAVKMFMEKNPEKAKALEEKLNNAGKKMLEIIGKVGNAVLMPDKAYAFDEEQIQTAQEIVRSPDSPAKRQTMQDVKAMEDQIYPLLATGKIDDLTKAQNIFRQYTGRNHDAGPVFQFKNSRLSGFFNSIDGYTKAGGYSSDLAGVAVNASINSDYVQWASDARDLRRNPNVSPEVFVNQIKRGKAEKNAYGNSFYDILRYNHSDQVEEMQWRADGYRYALGDYTDANFGNGKTATRQLYKDLAYYRPGETKTEYDKRITALVQDTKQFPDEAFSDIINHYQDKGQMAVVDALQKIKEKQYVRIPLDAVNKNLVESARQYVYDNIDDPAALYNHFKDDKNTTEIVRQFDPKTYRMVESKIFGQLDSANLSYMKNSRYDPLTLDRVKRMAPDSFNRLYYKNPEFQAVAQSLGIPPPQPSDDTAVTREYWDKSTNQMVTTKVASINATPEVFPPEPIPAGSFSSFPNTMDLVQQRARVKASQLHHLSETAPQNLSQSDRQFLNASPSGQVFSMFPSVIGQGFVEGKLHPNDVISSFKELADFGAITGQVSPESHAHFTEFLTNASNVFGATNFGFRLGKFLDDTFNVPALPIHSRAMEFLLAGSPQSEYGKKVRLVSPISPQLQGIGDPNRSPIPSNFAPPPAAGQGEAAIPDAQKTPLPPKPTTTEQAQQLSAAGSGLPGIGTVFAFISAGLAINNMIQSGRQRARMARAAQQADADRQRQINEARMAAYASQSEQLARSAAEERLRVFQEEERQRHNDFVERSREFLRNGATMAHFSQQPKEFQNRFADQFGPELLQFSRRPQYQSRLNLIESVAGRIPKARY